MPISSLTEYDIVCGHDNKANAQRRGNVAFNLLIRYHARHYFGMSSKREKMRLTASIVTQFQSLHGSRFLKKKEDMYVELSFVAARDKVSHALRFAAQRIGAGAVDAHPTMPQFPRLSGSERGVGSWPVDSIRNGGISTDQVQLVGDDDDASFGSIEENREATTTTPTSWSNVDLDPMLLLDETIGDWKENDSDNELALDCLDLALAL